MITNSIAMWKNLQNNAGWDCFKTPILQEILRTQNPLLEEHFVFLEVIHSFQLVGCVRNKLQFHTVQQNPKTISLDAGLRLDGIPALDFWDLIVLVLGNTTQTHDRTVRPVENCDKSHGPNKRSQGMINVLNHIDSVSQTSNYRIKKLCCMYLMTTKQ